MDSTCFEGMMLQNHNIAFADLILPWVDEAFLEIDPKLSLDLYFEDKAIEEMKRQLLQKLSSLLYPTLMKEMKVYQLESMFYMFDSATRYQEFIENRFANEEAQNAFWLNYPVLKQIKNQIISLFIASTQEFIERIVKDHKEIANIFFHKKTLGKVLSIKMGEGDSHNGGRSVSIIEFEEGSVVYKPKSLKVIEKFNQFLSFLNEEGLEPKLKSYKVLAKDQYGWEEKVEWGSCQTPIEVEKYFERSGALLALLYFFNGSDVHFENIIASFEHPVLIDLETIFHTSIKKEHDDVDRTFSDSVLKVGLLPSYIFLNDGKNSMDVSGLGKVSQTLSVKKWDKVNTDEMEIVYKTEQNNSNPNQVHLQNTPVELKDYEESFVLGFEKLYKLFQQKPHLIKRGFSMMKDQPVRIVIRATRFYAAILQDLYNSSFSSEIVEDILKVLDKPFGSFGIYPKEIREKEKEALLKGDIPCFHSFPKSTDLFINDELVAKDVLEPFLEKPLSDSNLEFQKRIIRHSFFLKNTSVHENRSLISTVQKQTPQDPLECAIKIGDEILSKALKTQSDSLLWIFLEPNMQAGRYNLVANAANLYSGTIGIGLFFSALSKVTCDDKWTAFTHKALESIAKKIQKTPDKVIKNGIGGMSGVGGIIYGLTQISKNIKNPKYLHLAQSLVKRLNSSHIEEDTQYDIIGGSAGLILSLDSYYKVTKDPKALDLIKVSIDHLKKSARHFATQSVAWGDYEQPFLGFSHGTAGIAYAFLRAFEILKDPSLLDWAKKAIQYEREHFSKEHQNWPRFNIDGGEPYFVCAWCHGSTGIGLGRVASMAILEDSLMKEEIEVARQNIEKMGPMGFYNLCCGDLGRFEFLNLLAKDQTFEKYKDNILKADLASLQQENLGFMQGKAGIGYTLLKMVDPTLSQVLLLES